MELRLLGRSGTRVSAVGFGAMNLGTSTDLETGEPMLLSALDAGINLVDTADVYGESEAMVGDILRRSGRRDEVVIATKCGLKSGPHPNDAGGSRRHLVRSCEASLRRLGVDHIDLYQLHRPFLDTAPEETLAGFDHLVRSGKVLQIGTSTHPAWFLMECLAVSDRYGWARYVSEQSPYNLLDRRLENERVPLAQRHGLGLLVWSPLAAGILAGRYVSSSDLPADSRAAHLAPLAERVSDRGLSVAREVASLAVDRGLTPGQLALLWVRDQPGITSALIGPRTPEQLSESLAVCDHPPLDVEVLDHIDRLVAPGTWVSDFHNSTGWQPNSPLPAGAPPAPGASTPPVL
jgi:aryl-alcohol dehydrogenase-like predicted oxidoreductase